MAVVDSAGIARFLSRWTAVQVPKEGEDVPKFYARLRAGRVKKGAPVVWRRDLAGADGKALAVEILDRHGQIGVKNVGVLEIVQIGGAGCLDTLALGSPNEESDEQEDVPVDPGSILGVAVNAIVATNAQLADRLSSQENRYHDLLTRHVEIAGRATAAETMLEWIEKHGLEDQGMAAAVEMLAPYLGPAVATMASKWGQGGQGGKGPRKPATPEDRAVKAIAEVSALCDQHPDVLKGKQAELIALGMKLQKIIMPEAA